MIQRATSATRSRPHRSQRGSLLISAMLISTAVALGLTGYLNLSHNSLKLSQRTYFLNAAANLAEAGLEEAIYCYRLVDGGSNAATAWANWTLSGHNAQLTLPAFSLGQNAIGTVKVYVLGYDGTLSTPSCVAQSTITPLDGSPVVKKSLKVSLKKKGAYNAAILTRSSLTLGASTTVDSFSSNPSGSSSSARTAYDPLNAKTNGNLISTRSSGTITLGANAMVKGNALLAASSHSLTTAQVSGSIITSYTGTPFPSYSLPTFPGMQLNTFGLFSSIPATLPEAGDKLSADGRYYYLAPLKSLGSTRITTGKNVTILVLTMSGGLVVESGASCIVWTIGDVNTSGATGFTNNSWAGALEIYGIFTTSVSLGHSGNTMACIYAPLATVSLSGGGTTKTFTGAIIANHLSAAASWSFHYDEALTSGSNQVGTGWSLVKWHDLQGTSEILTLGTLTGGFLN